MKPANSSVVWITVLTFCSGGLPLQAQWSKNKSVGPYDYTKPANWYGGVINNLFTSSPADGLTLTFDTDFTLTSAVVLGFSGSSSVTFRSDSATPRTLRLSGNFVRTNQSGGTITIGTNGYPLILDLNGATRTLGGANTSASGNATMNIYAQIIDTSGRTNGVNLSAGRVYTYLRNGSNRFIGPVKFSGLRGGGFTSIRNIGAGPSALGAPTDSASGTITVADNTSFGSLSYLGTGDTSDRPFVWNLTGNTYSFQNQGSGKLTFTGPWTLPNRVFTINAVSDDIELDGYLKGAGTTNYLSFQGGNSANQIILTGPTNDFPAFELTNVVLVYNSIANAGAACALGTGTNIVFKGGTLQYLGPSSSHNRSLSLFGAVSAWTLENAATNSTLTFTANFLAAATGPAGARTINLNVNSVAAGSAALEVQGAIPDVSPTNATSLVVGAVTGYPTNSGGTVRLLGPTNSFTGGLQIKYGRTVEAVDLDVVGQPSSIGTGSQPPSGQAALTFGSPDGGADPNTLAYIGINDATCDFPIMVQGGANGGGMAILNNSPNNSSLHLSAPGAWVFGAGMNGGSVTLDGNAAAVNILDSSIPNTATGNLNLTVNGSTWMLKGINTYAGTTTVNGGVLLVNGSIGGSGVIVTNGTLGGTGTIDCPVTILSNGTLQPGLGGAGIADLTNNGSLNLAGKAIMALNRTNAQTASLVNGLSAVTYGGTLTVTNEGDALQEGDTFTLFAASSYAGAFARTNLPALGDGLVWDTSGLARNGRIAVARMPYIIAAPASQTVECTSNATFRVTAGGTPRPSYQWSVNGAAVAGATSTTFVTNNVHAGGSAYTISVEVANVFGSTSSVATLSVQDTLRPVITLNGANPITVECHGSYTEAGATAVDACAGNVAVQISGNVDTNTPGTYILTYTASDGYNTATNTRTVNVQDTTAPALNCPSTLWVTTTNPAGANVSFTVTATDGCDSSPTVVCTPASGSLFPLGTNTVSCYAYDSSYNTNSSSFQIVVTYQNPPGLIASDPFTDGSRMNTSGGDPAGLVYYMGQTSGTLVVTDDSAGIGSGNALLFTPAAAWGKYLAYFGPVALTNQGDAITLTFNYRFTSAPTNISAGLRVGLYNSLGTRQSGDASDTGFRTNDVGYGFQSNPGNTLTNGTTVYSEAAGNDILGGATPSATANQGKAGGSLNSGTSKHSALFQIARQPSGDLALIAQLDGALAAYATIPAASVLTNCFDEFAIGEGGTGFSVPFLIDNLTITTTKASDYDNLRVQWWQLQTGGTNYDLNDNLVKSRLTSITNTAWSYWNSMNKATDRTYLWSDLTSTNDSSEITTAYTRLRAMALAYTTYGSGLCSNSSLATDIQGGLDWMFTNRYKLSIAAPYGEYGNWWDWEIGTPLMIADLSVFMYDALGFTGLSNTLSAMEHFVPTPFSGTAGTCTGGNLTDKLRAVAVRGAVTKDAGDLTTARAAFGSLFPYVTSGDGYYADGSFIQHTRHPYNGSYGAVALGDVALVLPWLIGSPWQVTDPNQTNVIQWVYSSYEPLVYFGAMMDMTRGRAVSRYSSEDHTAGSPIIQSILTLAVSPFPASADAARMRSMVKYWALADTYRNFTNNVPLQLISATEQLMADTNTVPRGELLGHWTFAGMDRVVHLRPGWGFGLSLSSSRIYNYESINGENLHGWFEGDGVTYLYNADLGQFSGNYWPTVDPYRLPGTTVDSTAKADSAGQSYLSANNWVGGVTLYTNGAAGMDLDPYGSPLVAKKSWFMFDDEVVCLGAGITCTNSADIQTTALNRKLSSANTNVFTIDGTTMPTTLGWQTNLTGVNWCSLDGVGGVYFPGGATVNALREGRTNAWSEINSGGTTSLKNNPYLTLWFDHGVAPADAAYSYVLLPNYSAVQASNYSLSPKILVLTNTADVQGVKQTGLNAVAANFWQSSGGTVDLITVDNRASVLTQEGAGDLSFAIADPTRTNTGIISVTLNRQATSVAFNDPAISVTQLSPTITMNVNVNGALGRSLVAKFNLQQGLAASSSAVTNSGSTVPSVSQVTMASNGQITLCIMGGSGPNYLVQASTNLVDWETIFTTSEPVLPLIWTDTNAPSFQKRFYRVGQAP